MRIEGGAGGWEERAASAHFGQLGSSAASHLGDTQGSELSHELLQLLLKVALVLRAKLVNLDHLKTEAKGVSACGVEECYRAALGTRQGAA